MVHTAQYNMTAVPKNNKIRTGDSFQGLYTPQNMPVLQTETASPEDSPSPQDHSPET